MGSNGIDRFSGQSHDSNQNESRVSQERRMIQDSSSGRRRRNKEESDSDILKHELSQPFFVSLTAESAIWGLHKEPVIITDASIFAKASEDLVDNISDSGILQELEEGVQQEDEEIIVSDATIIDSNALVNLHADDPTVYDTSPNDFHPATSRAPIIPDSGDYEDGSDRTHRNSIFFDDADDDFRGDDFKGDQEGFNGHAQLVVDGDGFDFIEDSQDYGRNVVEDTKDEFEPPVIPTKKSNSKRKRQVKKYTKARNKLSQIPPDSKDVSNEDSINAEKIPDDQGVTSLIGHGGKFLKKELEESSGSYSSASSEYLDNEENVSSSLVVEPVTPISSLALDYSDASEIGKHSDVQSVDTAEEHIITEQPVMQQEDLEQKSWRVALSNFFELFIAFAVGGAIFFSFMQLWQWEGPPYLAAILAVVVLLAIVTVVIKFRKIEDSFTVILAIFTGLLITFGPLVLLRVIS